MTSYVEAHMVESLKDHVLELVSQTETVSAWYLKKAAKTRMMSTLILFTPEGIVLQGDLTPGQNGNVSTYGYGVGWFSGHKSEDYLCEKFLEKEFVPELAYETFKDRILSRRREAAISKDEAREVFDINENHGSRHDQWLSHEFYETYSDFGFEYDGEGYGYNLREAGWLCAIQQRFSELYLQTAEEKVA